MNMKLKKLIAFLLVFVMTGCNFSVKENLVKKTNYNGLKEYLHSQFEDGEYKPISLDHYYSTLQAGHYILINKLLGNKVGKDILNKYKQELQKEGEMDYVYVIDLLEEENMLNEQEIAHAKDKLETELKSIGTVTEKNWYRTYYDTLILHRINKFDMGESIKKLKHYIDSLDNNIDKIQPMYCYCILNKEDPNLKSDSSIKNFLADVAKEDISNLDGSDIFSYYYLLNLFDLGRYKDKEFIASVENGLYDVKDNVNLDRLYLKLEILNEADKNIIAKHKSYVDKFLNSFKLRDEIIFPLVVQDEASPSNYYQLKLVMEKYLGAENSLRDRSCEKISNLDLSSASWFDLMDILYKLIYDKFAYGQVDKTLKNKLEKQIKKLSPDHIMEGYNYLLAVIWNLIGNDVNEILNKNDVLNKLKTCIAAKKYSDALQMIDLLNLMGMDNKILQPYFKETFGALDPFQRLSRDQVYLLYLLRYKIEGEKLTDEQIDKMFNVNYLTEDFPVVGNRANINYLEVIDYLYYYALKNMDDVSNFVR